MLGCTGHKELPNYSFSPNFAMLPTSNCNVGAREAGVGHGQCEKGKKNGRLTTVRGSVRAVVNGASQAISQGGIFGQVERPAS